VYKLGTYVIIGKFPGAIPFNVHTPLWTSSIKFEPLRKKDQSADPNMHPPQKLRNVCLTPQKKRKDQRMLMHTTPQKRLFQTPSEILVHRGGGGGCILNEWPLIYQRILLYCHIWLKILHNLQCKTNSLCCKYIYPKPCRLYRKINPLTTTSY
jgi:hypothetical protein